VSELEDLLPDLEGTGDAELHALIERAHQIELLTQHPGWPLLADYLTHLTIQTQSYVLGGNCKTLEDYAAKTGFVRGLQEALDAPVKLLRRVALIQAERDAQ